MYMELASVLHGGTTLCWKFFLILFFFSSRRRHTRLVSDWSSDVCSSDLGRVHEGVGSASSPASRLSTRAGIGRSKIGRASCRERVQRAGAGGGVPKPWPRPRGPAAPRPPALVQTGPTRSPPGGAPGTTEG